MLILLPLSSVTKADIVDNGGSLQLAQPSAPQATNKAQPNQINSSGAEDNSNETGVILFGVSGCPYAKKAMDMMSKLGIQYKYVDLNSAEFRKNYEQNVNAKFSSEGMTRVRNPYLKYNGMIYDLNSIYDVIQKIK